MHKQHSYKFVEKKEETDLRVLKTRRLIEEAFVQLMEEKGYTEISVKEIAERATINRATFYAHFIDKEDLFRYFLKRSFEQILIIKKPDDSNSESKFLESLLTSVFEYMDWLAGKCQNKKSNGDLPLPEELLRVQLNELIFTRIEKLKKENREIKIESEVLALACSSTIVSVARSWSQKWQRPPLQEVKKQLQIMIEALLEVASIHIDWDYCLPEVKSKTSKAAN